MLGLELSRLADSISFGTTASVLAALVKAAIGCIARLQMNSRRLEVSHERKEVLLSAPLPRQLPPSCLLRVSPFRNLTHFEFAAKSKHLMV